MVIVDYNRKNHKEIILACVHALRAGKVVAYPTDTSYGLACDLRNKKALKRLYNIKERGFNKPVHIVVPSIAFAKNISAFNRAANLLAKKFWPGPLTLVLELRSKKEELRKLSAGTGTIGIRNPKNTIARDLAKYLKYPIPATSANPSAAKSGGFDSYSAEDVVRQFEKKKYKPDIIINAGKLPKRKPSTMVKIDEENITILRQGPVSEKQIKAVLGGKR